MKLSIQISSFVFSFLFIMLIACIYFVILLIVNNGVVHIYFLLSILVGYIFVYKFTLWMFTRFKKK